MASAVFRFYAELNDFLPPARRYRDLELEFEAPAPVRHLIEGFGVPHTEVEIILVNGVSVDLGRRIEDQDRVSVYPMFESLDITPLVRLRERPLREPHFVVDAHLGRLGRYLRLLGFDTLYVNDYGDRQLVAISVREKRILLTRDRALLMHRDLTHGCYIRAISFEEQLTYVIRRLDLSRCLRPFTRCMCCNGQLEPVEKARVLVRLPESVRRLQDEFWSCVSCGRVYWKGSHYRRMQQRLQDIRVGCESKADV